MGKGYHQISRRRSRRYATRAHQLREAEQRGVRRGLEPDPRVEAHEPAHPYGCLTCFVARQQERRAGGQP